MARIFTVPLYVIVGDAEDSAEPATPESVKNYLSDALVLDVDTEEYGNPIACSATYADIEGLTELPPEQVTAILAEMQEAEDDEI